MTLSIFAKLWARSLMKVCGGVCGADSQGGPSFLLEDFDHSLPTDMFPRVAKRRRQGGPPGKKQQEKKQRPVSGRGQGGNWRPPKPKGRSQGVKTKLGPRATRRNLGQPSRRT